MNKRVILIALTAVMLSTVSYAQKVIKEGTAVIIDCSEMDPKFYVSDTKARTTNATNSTTGSADLSVISSKMSNEKVYKKFEVQKTDNGKLFWEEAINICVNLNSTGTDWRLPTQRELMLMWVLKEKLVKANGFTAFDAYGYWSATEAADISAWHVNFSIGTTVSNIKYSASYCARCIRDIE